MTTPANTLTTTEAAGIVLTSDPTTGILAAAYSATSDDPGIASIVVEPAFHTILVAGQDVGETTITVTRHADGASASLDVTVTPSTLGGFSVALGTAIPK